MPQSIPASHRDLLTNPLVAILNTVTPEGQPHSSVNWCRLVGDRIQIVTPADAKKAQNIRHNPQVSLLAVDTNDAFRYIEVRGEASLSTENVIAILREIARDYNYPQYNTGRLVEQRVVITITPQKVIIYG
jgi:PPOX class probable F420-dependent enzyme